jgi:hypothetical protein
MPALYLYQSNAVAELETGATLLAALPGAGKTACAIEFAKQTGARGSGISATGVEPPVNLCRCQARPSAQPQTNRTLRARRADLAQRRPRSSCSLGHLPCRSGWVFWGDEVAEAAA